MDGRADLGQVAELAPPLLGGNAAYPLHKVQHELPDGCRWRGPGCSCPDQPAEPILDLLIEIRDQPLLGLEVVVDGLSGDLGLARDIADRDLLKAALGKQTRIRRPDGRSISSSPRPASGTVTS
jgi:hypothetical protein